MENAHSNPAPRSQLDPRRVLPADRFIAYERSVNLRARLVDLVVGLIDRPDMSICDVGGASGTLLNEVLERTPHPVRGAVLEVLEEYRDKLVNPEIEFLHGSVLESGVAGERFDLVIFRHLLHHLVSDTVDATLELQARALSEMVRMLRPGGCLVFQEQVHRVRPFSRAVYALSRLANRWNLRWSYFETGRVVVSFMTPAEIRSVVARLGTRRPLEVVEDLYRSRPTKLRWKLTLLMASVGDLYMVIRKGLQPSAVADPGSPDGRFR